MIDLGSRPGFLRTGVTTAVFRPISTMLDTRDLFFKRVRKAEISVRQFLADMGEQGSGRR